jgi:hypothetical protein
MSATPGIGPIDSRNRVIDALDGRYSKLSTVPSGFAIIAVLRLPRTVT